MKKKLLSIGLAGAVGITGVACLAGCDNQKIQDEIQKYQQESEQKDKTIEDLNSQLLVMTGYYEACLEEKRVAEEEIKDKNEQINTLNTQIEEKNTEISTLNASIKDNETEISILETEKSNLETQVEELQADKNADQTTITSLNGQIEAINAQISTLTEQKSELEQNFSVVKNEIATLNEQKGELDTQIAQLNAQILQKDNEIAVLMANQPKAKAGNRYYMSFEDAMEDSSNETITLYKDALVESLILNNQTIDLNGNTIEVTKAVSISGEVTIKNGNIIMTNATNKSQSNISVGDGETLTIENVTMNVNGSGIGTDYSVENAVQTIVIKNSTITSTGYYAVATNASKKSITNNITIENSTISVANDEFDNCAICFNTKGELNIMNSNISGERQGVIVRAGEATIVDSTITVVSKFTSDARNTGKWASGNEVATGALIVGNKDSAGYNASATVTIENSAISGTNADDNEAQVFDVYVVETNTVNGVEYTASVNYIE